MFRFSLYTAVAIGVVFAIASNAIDMASAPAPAKPVSIAQTLGVDK